MPDNYSTEEIKTISAESVQVISSLGHCISALKILSDNHIKAEIDKSCALINEIKNNLLSSLLDKITSSSKSYIQKEITRDLPMLKQNDDAFKESCKTEITQLLALIKTIEAHSSGKNIEYVKSSIGALPHVLARYFDNSATVGEFIANEPNIRMQFHMLSMEELK